MTYAGQMVGGTVPSILASAAPHSRRHAAESAWVADERIRVHGVVGKGLQE